MCQLTGASGCELVFGVRISGSQLKDWGHLGYTYGQICVSGEGGMTNRPGAWDLLS